MLFDQLRDRISEQEPDVSQPARRLQQRQQMLSQLLENDRFARVVLDAVEPGQRLLLVDQDLVEDDPVAAPAHTFRLAPRGEPPRLVADRGEPSPRRLIRAYEIRDR